MESTRESAVPKTRVLPEAPEELTSGRLRRLGEGVGKVVYASQNWVVRRERSPFEVVAIVLLWHWLRKLQGLLPRALLRRLQHPSRQIRFLRVVVQAVMLVVPKSVWFTRHIREVWRTYLKRDIRGERLAGQHLVGTALVPQRITFPPTRVAIAGWPGVLTVCEANERVEATLYTHLVELSSRGDFDAVERWLDRFLDLRQSGWQRGLFSVDAHLKNFGVCGERLVLLDTGGLTDRWREIEEKLSFEDVVSEPHIQLGLGPVLSARADIAQRFNSRWKSVVRPEVVRQHWPANVPG